MNTVPSILVAIDFSVCSRSALDQAARIATRQKARLNVLHVIDNSALASVASHRGEPYESAAKVAVESGRKALETWLAQSSMPPGFEITIVVGHPLHEILEHAKYLHVDLLVAGVTGSGDNPAGAGSVSTKLARKSPSNILLVRSGHSEPYSKVVACVDFSKHSQLVAETARDYAFQDGTGVDFVHVWADPGTLLPVMGPFGESGLSMTQANLTPRNELISALQTQLEKLVTDSAPGIATTASLHEDRNVGRGIADHAQSTGADLIVIGAHGHASLQYMLLGSTAERVLSRLPCSVLVVKPAAV